MTGSNNRSESIMTNSTGNSPSPLIGGHPIRPAYPSTTHPFGLRGRACPAKGTAVLGFDKPTKVPCGLLSGHDGPHRYEFTWTTS